MKSALAAEPICTNLSLQLDAKKTGRLNVKDFGALGDYNADDTISIQQALDCAVLGYTVYFPPGSYKTTKGLIVHRYVDLMADGIGWASVIYPTNLPANDSAINIDGTTQTGGWGFKNTISGLNIDMWHSPGNRAIKINNAYNVRVVDSYIRSFKKVQGTTSAVAGIDINTSNHITLDHVIIFGEDPGQGIGLKVNDSWVTVLNADIEGHLICVKVSESVVGKGKLNMIGGYMERMGDRGISFENTQFNNIEGVAIRLPNNSPNGIRFINSTNNNINGVSLTCATGVDCNALVNFAGNNVSILTNLIQGNKIENY